VPGGPVATAGTLILDDSKDFHGVIVGLTENSSESLENRVDLKDLTYRAGHMSAHLSGSAVTVSNGINSVTINLSGGSSGSFELAADATGGTLLDDPPAFGMVTIDSGKTLDISAASTATVSFTNSYGNTGELVLDDSKDFTGQIVGFAGDGTISNSDLINLTDVNIADVAIDKTTYTDNGNGTGTLTLYNTNGQALDSITFVGSYQLANFTIESDGSGHTLIVDPPVPSGTATVGSDATTEIKGASGETVQFASTDGNNGSLVLDNSADFTGKISGFAGDGTRANSDTIDLKDIAFSSLTNETYVENSDGTGGTLTLSDGTGTANINFSGNYVLQNFSFSNDGSGGTLIVDPPVTSAASQQTGTATIDVKGILDLEAPTTANVVFGSGAAGTLKLGDSFHFNGTISGFGASDTVDLADVGSATASISYHENAAGNGGTLAISGGAQIVELSLLGHYSADNFSIVPDQVHGTLITYVPHDLML
jgi:hypothetical protein